VFPVRYELSFYILFRRHSVFKGLNDKFKLTTYEQYIYVYSNMPLVPQQVYSVAPLKAYHIEVTGIAFKYVIIILRIIPLCADEVHILFRCSVLLHTSLVLVFVCCTSLGIFVCLLQTQVSYCIYYNSTLFTTNYFHHSALMFVFSKKCFKNKV
jgi:hypothetical protein